MRTETLQICYSRSVRPNRRRTQHPIFVVCARVILLIVAMGIVIAILIKLGVFQENPRPIYVAAALPLANGGHEISADSCVVVRSQ
jgi:hypothetical protein